MNRYMIMETGMLYVCLGVCVCVGGDGASDCDDTSSCSKVLTDLQDA